MTPREKAEQASRILADEVFQLMLAELREDLIRKLETAPIGDHELQHEVALMLQLLGRMRAKLVSFAQDQIVDNHRRKQETFIERLREKLSP